MAACINNRGSKLSSCGTRGGVRHLAALLTLITTTLTLLGIAPLVEPQDITDVTVNLVDGTTEETYGGGTCSFNTSEDSISVLNETLGVGNFFIYLNLAFSEPLPGAKGYLSDQPGTTSSNIINPLKWVFALEGKGNLLLTLPFDFTQLSLGALLPGVDHVDVYLEADPTCFQKGNDSEVLQEIAEVLFTIASTAYRDQPDDSFSICVERQLSRDELDSSLSFFLPGSSYILFQTSTVYDCWADSGDGTLCDGPVVLTKYRSLIYSVYFIGILLALYSPLAGMFFVRISPTPTGTTGAKTIAVHADIPYGVKYNLLFSGGDHQYVRLLRWVAIVLVFGVLPYVPYVAWAAAGQLAGRMEAIDRAGVLSYLEVYGTHTFIEFCYCVTVASLLVFTFKSSDGFTRRLQVREVDRKYFGLVELPGNLQIPENVQSENEPADRRVYGFFRAMAFRCFGLVNTGLYSYFFGTPFSWIHDSLLGPHLGPGLFATTLTVLAYTVALPIISIFFVFNMVFYAIPLGDVVMFLYRQFLGNHIDPREVLTAGGIILLSVAMFFKCIAVFVYIGELVGFTFVGFILHTEAVGQYITVGVLFAGVILNAITGYYDGYCQLLLRVIERAQGRDGGIQSAKTLQQAVAGTINSETVSFNKLVFCNDQGVPFVEVDLFERVVNKYRPVKVEIFKIVSQLGVLAVFILLGLSIIKTIDGFSDIPETIEFFATVIVAGVLPVVALVLRSPGKTECLDESKWRQLENDLDFYANNGKFESDFLQF